MRNNSMLMDGLSKSTTMATIKDSLRAEVSFQKVRNMAMVSSALTVVNTVDKNTSENGKMDLAMDLA